MKVLVCEFSGIVRRFTEAGHDAISCGTCRATRGRCCAVGLGDRPPAL